MKRGIETYFVSLKGFQRNFEHSVRLFIKTCFTLLISLHLNRLRIVFLNQSSKQLHTLALSWLKNSFLSAILKLINCLLPLQILNLGPQLCYCEQRNMVWRQSKIVTFPGIRIYQIHYWYWHWNLRADHKNALKYYNKAAGAAIKTKSLCNIFLGHSVFLVRLLWNE